ncbi:desmoplakin-like protein [Lates japonicus]|uniref:Desmoplakin-like protein n=1 Tax=Lates japonicus TaxID=270547 RepID=A0AAD3M806_LATJO|nr:desmoplakin-like protein [Lates japonicus]
MSLYGSQQGLNRRIGSKGDLTGGGTCNYALSELVHGGGNRYDPYMDGYKTYTFHKASTGGMGGGMMSGTGGGMV